MRLPPLPAVPLPTGPRAGVKPHRLSPTRKGPYGDTGRTLEYRDTVEKNWRKHLDNGLRHNFKPVADTYRPGYPETDRRYLNGRDRGFDDPSRFSPPQQGRDGADKSYMSLHRSRDSTRDQASQERSGSPLLRARIEVAREVADRITRESLGNLPKTREDGNQGQKRAGPPEIYQTDLAAAGASSDVAPDLSQTSLLSRGLPYSSQRPNIPLEQGSAVDDEVIIVPTENIPRIQSINGEPPVLRGNSSIAVSSTSVLHKGNSVGDSSNGQIPLPSVPCTTEVNPPSATAGSRLPPKPPVIQPPNLSYEPGLHILAGHLKLQHTTHLQPSVEDAPSVNSDLTVVTRKSTQEGSSSWRCSRCTKTLRTPSQFNTTPARSSLDPSFHSSRQSPVSVGPKIVSIHTDGQPPRKKLRTESGDVAITMPVPDSFDARYSPREIPREESTPIPPTNRPQSLIESSEDLQNRNSSAPLGRLRNHVGSANSEMLDATNVLAPSGGPPPASGLAPSLELAPITDKNIESSRSWPTELSSNKTIPSNESHYSEVSKITLLSSNNMSSHFRYGGALKTPVAMDAIGIDGPAPIVTLPWRAETPAGPVKGLGLGIQMLRTGNLSPKGSQSGTDQSTSSGTTSDIPRDIESANTSIGSPVAPATVLEVKEVARSKADDELSDTSMSLDSTHSPSPDGKERVTHENNHNSEPSSPPYSPRLDAFVHSDDGSAPVTADTATIQPNPTNGVRDIQTNGVHADTGQSPPSGGAVGKGYSSHGSVMHTSQTDSLEANPFNTSPSPVLSTSGDSLYLHLPRTNSYISSSMRRRPEPNPAPGLLIPQKRRKPQAVARKVASVPTHTLETSQGNTSRPIMKKANELRTPEKAKQHNPHVAKKSPGIRPDSSAISTETDLRQRLKMSFAENEELRKTLERQKSALQNYASKTSSLSDDLRDKERGNQELSADAKKLRDQISQKEKRIEELQKIEDENKDLRFQLTQALSEIKQHIAENRTLEGKLAQALNDKQRALKEKHQALDEKQQAVEKSHQALMEKQQTYLELEEQQKLLVLERERAEGIQKRQKSTERKIIDPPAPDSNQIQTLQKGPVPANASKPTVSCIDLEYGALNPFEAYPDMEIVMGRNSTRTVTKVMPNCSRRFRKLGTRQRLDFALMDRRFIHRQRLGLPATANGNNSGNSSGQGTREWRNDNEDSGDSSGSCESDDSDLEIPIEELVGAPAEIMPTIQENGRLCFRDGTLVSAYFRYNYTVRLIDPKTRGRMASFRELKSFIKLGSLTWRARSDS
ncbi:hypothetical protein GP486_002370 [Trichoglossum hirsutum]|uniref:Uncharacterized protein n=1 Tax=Trichoglossum hirsutum TaxID=265104 RepID=A0A9P8RS69_9PEZI|nr:hypothetical protein GP486_002370 [Trichoglossum hirsutum]